MLVLVTLPWSLCVCFKVSSSISSDITVLQIIQEYERAVIFRLGRIKACGSQSPGLHFILPCIDKLTAIDLRTQVFDVVPQEVNLVMFTIIYLSS